MYFPVIKRELAGLPFGMSSLSDATTDICEFAMAPHRGADVHLLNAYSVALAETDPSYRSCLIRSSCNLPDGKPLSLLTRWTREPLTQVRGPSLFEKVMEEGRKYGLRHYLLGSTPETLTALKASLEKRYPGLEIVGTASPPFRQLTADELGAQDRVLRESEAHIVWIGLGTPKQDFEAHRLARGGFAAIAVGAAFDYSAGIKKPAPLWMTRSSLEWLYRFASEPRRLWRRYLIGNFTFLRSVLRHALKKRL